MLFDVRLGRADARVDKAELERVVKLMNDVPFATAKIDRHTDNVGTEEYNLALSDRRAKAVVDYLPSSGVDPVAPEDRMGLAKPIPTPPKTRAEAGSVNRRGHA